MREVLVVPMKEQDEARLRYAEWEYSRRPMVDSSSDHTIGYVHLQAMGSDDINQWTREFYPVFDRQGLIIDVRHNGGGNIDSWLLGKLLRQAWMYWQPRVGNPSWNMQDAFRGHIVVLCDEFTASDGEAFTEGFKRLKLGKVIGVRTWGGEVWLSFDNTQADNGIASAAELGVYGPDGKWLIEGHGAEPDVVVDNLPHSTFGGNDEQLQAAHQIAEGGDQGRSATGAAAPSVSRQVFPIQWNSKLTLISFFRNGRISTIRPIPPIGPPNNPSVPLSLPQTDVTIPACE